MIQPSRLLVAIAVGLSTASFALQASAQPDTQTAPPGPSDRPSAHRIAALKKCTDGVRFASDRYVNCMTSEGENP
jgi:hypothetical protein